MMQFKAFKPEALNKIAGAMGYQGDMSQFQQFVEGDPQRKAQMERYTNAARMMASGGAVQKFAIGGTPAAAVLPSNYNPQAAAAQKQANIAAAQGGTPTPQAVTPQATASTASPTSDIVSFSEQRVTQPGVPVGGVTQAAMTPVAAGQEVAAGTGAVTSQLPLVNTALASTAQATQPQQTQANVMQATQATQAVNTALQATQAAQANPQDPRAQVTAAQQTASSVGNLQAAQGNAILMNNPQQRQIQQGELISGSAVDATKAAQATAQTQAAAATAQPSQQALVQTQLANLANQFLLIDKISIYSILCRHTTSISFFEIFSFIIFSNIFKSD